MLIAQFSDTHVRPAGQRYQDQVDANAMLDAAVKTLLALAPQPDVILFSGDLVDCGSPAAYEKARQLLAPLQVPILMLPGNHDDRQVMARYFPGQCPTPNLLDWSAVHARPDWPLRIIALDIGVPNQHHGDVTAAHAHWLRQRLDEAPDTPTLIFMHQPPVDSGIPYIDAYKCLNGERLAEVVRDYPVVERILCGHLHRFMTLRFAGTLLCTAPSTTTAIALRLDARATEASYVEPPALLLHHWTSAGLITHWYPVGDFPGPYPFA
ncbi:phosphodiesterase [Pseudomonas oryzihabitans]|uniref:phosphodiesterase n=1 Tax=Pseudomonas oryzihabitans TaxID=47885 RepID=UPI0011A960D6|nr:phosphodiesterase [Pseudomonas psychrotolerans]